MVTRRSSTHDPARGVAILRRRAFQASDRGRARGARRRGPGLRRRRGRRRRARDCPGRRAGSRSSGAAPALARPDLLRGAERQRLQPRHAGSPVADGPAGVLAAAPGTAGARRRRDVRRRPRRGAGRHTACADHRRRPAGPARRAAGGLDERRHLPTSRHQRRRVRPPTGPRARGRERDIVHERLLRGQSPRRRALPQRDSLLTGSGRLRRERGAAHPPDRQPHPRQRPRARVRSAPEPRDLHRGRRPPRRQQRRSTRTRSASGSRSTRRTRGRSSCTTPSSAAGTVASSSGGDERCLEHHDPQQRARVQRPLRGPDGQRLPDRRDDRPQRDPRQPLGPGPERLLRSEHLGREHLVQPSLRRARATATTGSRGGARRSTARAATSRSASTPGGDRGRSAAATTWARSRASGSASSAAAADPGSASAARA